MIDCFPLNTKHRALICNPLALAGLLLRLLENLLDDLLLLNQESTDNAVLDAASAAGTTVGTADVLLGARDLGVLAGTEGGDLKKREKCPSASLSQNAYFVTVDTILSTLLPPAAREANIPTKENENSGNTGTHTGELDATVTALGSGTLLLDVLVSELAAGGLDDANAVGPCVVPVCENPSISCSCEIPPKKKKKAASYPIRSQFKNSHHCIVETDTTEHDKTLGEGIHNVRVPAALKRKMFN